MFKDGALLAGSQLVGQGLLFARTVILARLLTRADMGIAALFQSTVFLFDMISDLNLGTFLVQSADGDLPEVQRTAQAVTVLRGAILGAIIYLAAGPVTYLFEVPHALAAFQLLAVLPLLKGFAHLDTSRLQRHTRYASSIIPDVGSQIVCLAAAYPVCRWINDYSAMLWILILQYAASTVLSHVVAERTYRWSMNSEPAGKMLRFGWPLLINGLLMFAVFQGDRVIIGAQKLFPHYTKDDLGLYSIAFSLALMPSMMLARVASSLLLPRMARVQDAVAAFQRQAALAMDGLAFAAGLLVILFAIAGGYLLVHIYGDKYADASVLIACLGAMQSIRIIRVGTTLTAMAKGDTMNSLVSNVARMLGLGAAIVAAVLGARLTWIAVAGCFGETVALMSSALRVVRLHKLPKRLVVRACTIAGVGMLIGGAGIMIVRTSARSADVLPTLAVAFAAFLAFAFGLCRDLRSELRIPRSKGIVAQSGGIST